MPLDLDTIQEFWSIKETHIAHRYETGKNYNLTKLSKDKRKAVLFYITGNTFSDGANGWLNLAPVVSSQDIIAVTIQYRLGALGWMSTLSGNFTGNLGMYDVKMALQWVQDNIGFFGGDADRVTIVGSGAGATIAHLLMLAPCPKTQSDYDEIKCKKSEYYFHRFFLL